jgi:hypothetical protein
MSFKSLKKISLKVENEGKVQSYYRIRKAYILVLQHISPLSHNRVMGKSPINPIGYAVL